MEGRNRLSHKILRELDPRFIHAQLFFIAEILGEINALDAQREVETIRDKLFEDSVEEDADAEHQSAIVELNQSLASEKERSKNLSGRLIDNAVKLNEKKKGLEKLSKQLAAAKLQVDAKENQRKKLDRQLKNAKGRNDKLKSELASAKQRLEESEAAQADYKARCERTDGELKETETEMAIVSGQLTAMQDLFTTATLEKPEIRSIFPALDANSTVRILDRRGTDKKDYLRKLLNQKQTSILYVQSEEKVEKLLTSVLPEKADVIGELYETTPEAEEKEILKKT